MNIIAYLLMPQIFFSLLLILSFFALAVMFSFMRQEKKTSVQTQEVTQNYQARIKELEGALIQNQDDYKSKLSQLEDTLKKTVEEAGKNASVFQAQLKEKEQLLAHVASVEARLSEKEVLLKKEISAKNELEKKLKDELSLARQMYEGLKDQYGELENSMERLLERIEKESLPEQNKQKPASAPRIEIKLDNLGVSEKKETNPSLGS